MAYIVMAHILMAYIAINFQADEEDGMVRHSTRPLSHLARPLAFYGPHPCYIASASVL